MTKKNYIVPVLIGGADMAKSRLNSIIRRNRSTGSCPTPEPDGEGPKGEKGKPKDVKPIKKLSVFKYKEVK